jgi:hypothetical protein
LPTIKLVDFKSQNNHLIELPYAKYAFHGNLTIEDIDSFINRWRQNALHPYFISQKLSEADSNKKSAIKKVNASGFYENVKLNKKNVLVLFTTGWCSHCKKVII